MSGLGAEFTGQDPSSDIRTQVRDPLTDPDEVNRRFAEIVGQDAVRGIETQLGATAFISQGFVAGIETRIRDYYLFANQAQTDTDQPPLDLQPELAEDFKALVIGIAGELGKPGETDKPGDPYSRLVVRIGRWAIRPFDIRNQTAIPAANHYLEPDTKLELLHVYTDATGQSYAGGNGVFLPLHAIGQNLVDEGRLGLDEVSRRPGTFVVKHDSLWDS